MACNCLKRLDSGFCRNDGKRYFGTFYETVNANQRYLKFYQFREFRGHNPEGRMKMQPAKNFLVLANQ